MTAIAREHLTFCFACTLRALPEAQAAALLLKEIYGFTIAEVANILEARPAQAKNWLQAGRAAMDAKYARTCALVAKTGVCYQCIELQQFFTGRPPDALLTKEDDRLGIVRELRDQPMTKWHVMLTAVLDNL